MADTERKSLKITEIEQPVIKDRKDNKGKYQLLKFKAKDGDTEHSYTTIKAELFDLIKPDAILDCEVKTEVRDEWTNRSVLQIYKDGQPVAGEKKQWRGGGGDYSPEQRASIESQVAAKIVAELWIAKAIDEVNPLVVTLKDWLFEKLGVKPIAPEKVAPAPVKPPESPPEASVAPSSSGRTAGFEPAKSGSSPGGAAKPFDSKEFIATAAILADRGMEKWKYDKILERLNKLSGLNHRTVAGGMMKLNEEQRNALTKELAEDFKAAQ